MFSAEQIVGIVDHTESRLVLATGIDKEIDRAAEACAGRALTLVLPADCPSRENTVGWDAFNAPGRISGKHALSDGSRCVVVVDLFFGYYRCAQGCDALVQYCSVSVETYAAYHEVDENDVELVVTAFGFVGSSLLGFYLTLLRGCRSILLRNWSAEEALEHIGRYHPTHLLLMPTHAIDILSCARLDATDCSSVRRGVVAGVAEPYRRDARNSAVCYPLPHVRHVRITSPYNRGMSDSWELLKTNRGPPFTWNRIAHL